MTSIRRMWLDFRALRYFVCVAEAGSFSKAAELLHIAQPALSRQVQKLEEELKVQLFVRSKSGVELTDAGLQLIPKANALMRQLSHAADDFRNLSRTVAGSLSLGLPPATGELLVAPLMRRCTEEYPEVRLKIVEGFSGAIFERLLNEELTAVLLHNPVSYKSLTIEPILVEPMFLVGPAAGASSLAPASATLPMDGLPFILPGIEHSSLRMLTEKEFAAAGLALNVRYEVEGLLLIKSMVAAGLGYTLCTYGAVHQQVMAGLLSAVKLARAGLPEVQLRLCLAYQTERREMLALRALREVIHSEIRTLVDQGKWRGDSQFATPPEREP